MIALAAQRLQRWTWRLALVAVVGLGACKSSLVRDEVQVVRPTTLSSGLDAFASADYVQKTLVDRNTDHWYGLYVGGRKAGYANLIMRKTEVGEAGGFVIELTLSLSTAGDTLQIARTMYFEDKPPYRAVSMRTRQTSAAAVVVRSFTPVGEQARFETIVDGKLVKTLLVDWPCDTLTSQFALMVPDVATLSQTQISKADVCSFDSHVNKNEIKQLEVVEITNRRIGGVAVKVVKLHSKGEAEQVWQTIVVAEGGVTLEMAFGEGLLLKLEDKQVATSNVAGMDVSSMAIKVPRPLGEPSKIDELNMIVKVTNGFEIPSGPNQIVAPRPDGRFDVTIRSVPGPAVTATERTEALVATADLNSDDPRIAALARELTANATTARDKVTALNAWVYRNLRKTLSTNLTTASQVFEHRAGDCTEHTLLFVALVRAIEIPARELTGVVYENDQLVGFGWHAWAEVELDGHWVEVDPTWNEPVANATHLKLGAGDDDESAANMGSLGIEIVYPVK